MSHTLTFSRTTHYTLTHFETHKMNFKDAYAANDRQRVFNIEKFVGEKEILGISTDDVRAIIKDTPKTLRDSVLLVTPESGPQFRIWANNLKEIFVRSDENLNNYFWKLLVLRQWRNDASYFMSKYILPCIFDVDRATFPLTDIKNMLGQLQIEWAQDERSTDIAMRKWSDRNRSGPPSEDTIFDDFVNRYLSVAYGKIITILTGEEDLLGRVSGGKKKSVRKSPKKKSTFKKPRAPSPKKSTFKKPSKEEIPYDFYDDVEEEPEWFPNVQQGINWVWKKIAGEGSHIEEEVFAAHTSFDKAELNRAAANSAKLKANLKKIPVSNTSKSTGKPYPYQVPKRTTPIKKKQGNGYVYLSSIFKVPEDCMHEWTVSTDKSGRPKVIGEGLSAFVWEACGKGKCTYVIKICLIDNDYNDVYKQFKHPKQGVYRHDFQTEMWVSETLSREGLTPEFFGAWICDNVLPSDLPNTRNMKFLKNKPLSIGLSVWQKMDTDLHHWIVDNRNLVPTYGELIHQDLTDKVKRVAQLGIYWIDAHWGNWLCKLPKSGMPDFKIGDCGMMWAKKGPWPWDPTRSNLPWRPVEGLPAQYKLIMQKIMRDARIAADAKANGKGPELGPYLTQWQFDEWTRRGQPLPQWWIYGWNVPSWFTLNGTESSVKKYMDLVWYGWFSPMLLEDLNKRITRGKKIVAPTSFKEEHKVHVANVAEPVKKVVQEAVNIATKAVNTAKKVKNPQDTANLTKVANLANELKEKKDQMETIIELIIPTAEQLKSNKRSSPVGKTGKAKRKAPAPYVSRKEKPVTRRKRTPINIPARQPARQQTPPRKEPTPPRQKTPPPQKEAEPVVEEEPEAEVEEEEEEEEERPRVQKRQRQAIDNPDKWKQGPRFVPPSRKKKYRATKSPLNLKKIVIPEEEAITTIIREAIQLSQDVLDALAAPIPLFNKRTIPRYKQKSLQKVPEELIATKEQAAEFLNTHVPPQNVPQVVADVISASFGSEDMNIDETTAEMWSEVLEAVVGPSIPRATIDDSETEEELEPEELAEELFTDEEPIHSSIEESNEDYELEPEELGEELFDEEPIHATIDESTEDYELEPEELEEELELDDEPIANPNPRSPKRGKPKRIIEEEEEEPEDSDTESYYTVEEIQDEEPEEESRSQKSVSFSPEEPDVTYYTAEPYEQDAEPIRNSKPRKKRRLSTPQSVSSVESYRPSVRRSSTPEESISSMESEQSSVLEEDEETGWELIEGHHDFLIEDFVLVYRDYHVVPSEVSHTLLVQNIRTHKTMTMREAIIEAKTLNASQLEREDRIFYKRASSSSWGFRLFGQLAKPNNRVLIGKEKLQYKNQSVTKEWGIFECSYRNFTSRIKVGGENYDIAYNGNKKWLNVGNISQRLQENDVACNMTRGGRGIGPAGCVYAKDFMGRDIDKNGNVLRDVVMKPIRRDANNREDLITVTLVNPINKEYRLEKPASCLLDSGADTNEIDYEIAQELGLYETWFTQSNAFTRDGPTIRYGSEEKRNHTAQLIIEIKHKHIAPDTPPCGNISRMLSFNYNQRNNRTETLYPIIVGVEGLAELGIRIIFK